MAGGGGARPARRSRSSTCFYREIVEALKKPDVIERLATQGGNELVGNTPEEFAQVIKNDLAKYAKLVKAAGIQPQ